MPVIHNSISWLTCDQTERPCAAISALKRVLEKQKVGR